ncbi:MAG: cupin domain-containing protein [Proteobacteria bacterium]|nr:cupin domain-containing protein [Pseudomonadota bacterium]
MRRVVTGHDARGRSVFISDGRTPRVVRLDGLPEVDILDEVWGTDRAPRVPAEARDPTVGMTSFVPLPGGTRFRFFTTLPEAWVTAARGGGADMSAVMDELQAKMPGLAESMEVENPGMHTTPTIDYGVVISGRIYLELDDGREVLLEPGDTYVQNGTRHAWRNRGREPCVIAVVMIGAERG